MKHLLLTITLGIISWPATAGLNIFACEPEWAALARELGRDHVTVYTATTAFQDPHHIQARPSLIAGMRQAELVICTGAGLESGWLPVLLRRSANPAVQSGNPGHFIAADYVSLLDIPTQLDRAEGDIHPEGDPHIHTDPRNIIKVALALGPRLAQLDPDNARTYQSNAADFINRWEAAMSRWETKGAKLKDVPIVTQHKSWTYLIKWLQLNEIARLEAKPGLPPSTAHLTVVLQNMQQKPARGILRAAYQNPKASTWLHKKTGIPVIILPYTVGGNDKANDLFELFDSTLQLLEVLKNE